VLTLAFRLYQGVRAAMRRQDEEDYETDSELLEISTRNWRPL
jgi:hypothetical protein